MSPPVTSPQVEPRHGQHAPQDDIQGPERDARGSWFSRRLFADVDWLSGHVVRHPEPIFPITLDLRLANREFRSG